MISTLDLANFKRHTNTRLALQPFSVLVGPNGAGKTSALEALHTLSLLHSQAFGEVFCGPRALERIRRQRSDSTALSLTVSGQSDGEPRSLRVRVPVSAGNPTLSVTRGESTHAGVSSTPLREQSFESYWPELHRCAFLRIDPRQVSAPSEFSTNPMIANDGSGLATMLLNLKAADDPAFDTIVEQLRRLVPEIRAVRSLPTELETPRGRLKGYRLEFDTDSGSKIDASDMSDGTLVLLVLLTVLHSPSRPRLLLLDSVETALHPTAQMQLARLLKQLVERDNSLQIVATTHSPFVIDGVAPESVQVFAKASNGTTGVRSLREHPEIERFFGKLSSGQIWTLDDEESWVLENAS